VFENRVLRRIFGPKRVEVAGGSGRLGNDELHNLYASPNIIRVIKSKGMRWALHVARIGAMGKAYSILVGKPEGKTPLSRPWHKCEDNIKMDIRDVGWVGVDWIHPCQDRDHWCVLGNAVMKLRVP
jgi:hypothetical protein